MEYSDDINTNDTASVPDISTVENLAISSHVESICIDDVESTNSSISNTSQEEMYAAFVDKYLKAWSYSKLKDEWRPPYANGRYGGIDFRNSETTALIRSTGWELIKQIGKKIISGDFNLTTISIPIKVMMPMTILQTIANSLFNYPLYLNLAAMNTKPLERLKYVIVACLSCFHKSSHFLKPLNPILGETYQMQWEDGSTVYLEQTSHHPPISHYILYGPKNLYKYYGYSNFSSAAWLNSFKLTNKGKRYVQFQDGSVIGFTFCLEQYSNSFWGVLRHESIGEMIFKDITNGYECIINIGNMRRQFSDHFEAAINLKGKPVSKVRGSYLSFIEFDGIRYWDIRENIDIKPIACPNQLPSSSVLREDRLLLHQKKLDLAQAAKEKLEVIQRNDRKLRDAAQKKGKW